MSATAKILVRGNIGRLQSHRALQIGNRILGALRQAKSHAQIGESLRVFGLHPRPAATAESLPAPGQAVPAQAPIDTPPSLISDRACRCLLQHGQSLFILAGSRQRLPQLQRDHRIARRKLIGLRQFFQRARLSKRLQRQSQVKMRNCTPAGSSCGRKGQLRILPVRNLGVKRPQLVLKLRRSADRASAASFILVDRRTESARQPQAPVANDARTARGQRMLAFEPEMPASSF
jgi:hypothetical protein